MLIIPNHHHHPHKGALTHGERSPPQLCNVVGDQIVCDRKGAGGSKQEVNAFDPKRLYEQDAHCIIWRSVNYLTTICLHCAAKFRSA